MTGPLRILVNGGTGTLGQATIAALKDHVAIGGSRRISALPEGMLYVPEDGRVDPARLEGIDAIINCAGRVTGTDAELTATNVDHACNLAAAAGKAGVARFVQVSSFSIFGPVEWIDDGTPIAPVTGYGRSKALAERALSDIDGLSVLNVRLPFMFDRHKPALLGPLIALFRRLPLFPVTAIPIRRSMLAYPDAAALLATQVRSELRGQAAMADPTPFTNDLLVTMMRERGLATPALFSVSKPVARLVRRFVPGIGQRLFASSELCPAHNAAAHCVLPNGIVTEIGAILDGMRPQGTRS